MRIFATLLFAALTCTSFCFAQIKEYYIDPDSTLTGIKQIHVGHLITLDPASRSQKKLLISIPGTTGASTAMKSLDSVAALEGYHAISIDYPNNRNTATFINSPDRAAFDKFRQELDFGTPVSDSVVVDTLNSIVNRVTRLVLYLARTRPGEGWDAFLQQGKMNWGLVTLAGHSQGAGHVSYIGHAFKVRKVIMLSGPQDFLGRYDMPAPWLSAPSRSAYNNFYSFLHEDDVYDTRHQVRNDLAVMHSDSSVIYRFAKMDEFPKNARIFISEIQIWPDRKNTGYENHMTTILPFHSKVWVWLLRN